MIDKRVMIINRVCAGFVIALNLFFAYGTFKIISSEVGLGILLLPITLTSHVLLVPAIASFVKKEVNWLVFFTNCFGAAWTLFWIVKFLTR